MNRYTACAITLGALSAYGCALAALSVRGSAVKVGNADSPDCELLGIVYGGGWGHYVSAEARWDSATNDIRNRTADMGGNYVVEEDTQGSRDGAMIRARAFRCPEAPSPSGPDVFWSPPPRSTEPPPPPSPPSEAPPPPGASRAEERLSRLKALLDRGVITQDEYDRRRAAIINSL